MGSANVGVCSSRGKSNNQQAEHHSKYHPSEDSETVEDRFHNLAVASDGGMAMVGSANWYLWQVSPATVPVLSDIPLGQGRAEEPIGDTRTLLKRNLFLKQIIANLAFHWVLFRAGVPQKPLVPSFFKYWPKRTCIYTHTPSAGHFKCSGGGKTQDYG